MRSFICTGLCFIMFFIWLSGSIIGIIPFFILLVAILLSEIPGVLQDGDEG